MQLGAADDLTPRSLFKGQIVSLELNFGAGGVELLCRGYDRSHVLIRSRRAQTFQNMTSSDIVTKIVQAAGFTADCDPSGDPHDFMQQDNETDWDFIWRLAERVGFEFVVEDQPPTFASRCRRSDPARVADDPALVLAPRDRHPASPAGHTARAGPEDQAVDLLMAANANQIAKIGVDRETVTGAFSAADTHVATEPVKTQSEGDALAQALLDKLANGYIAADGVSVGNPDIKTGIAIQVSGLGNKYSGTYRVAAVTHVLRGGSTYETRFANSPSHTLLGAVGGDRGGVSTFGSQLVLGVVTNNNDPDGLGRVRVRYPALGDDVEGAWARSRRSARAMLAAC